MRSSGEVIREEVINNPAGFEAAPEACSVSGPLPLKRQSNSTVRVKGGEVHTDRLMIYRQRILDCLLSNIFIRVFRGYSLGVKISPAVRRLKHL